MTLRLDNPFWCFSLETYAEPGVAEECLALQEAAAVDVNLLLFAAWIGAERRIALTPKKMADAASRVAEWHGHVVRPLRAVRRDVKRMELVADPAVADLRRQVAAIELAAEQVEQALLFGWSARLRRRADLPAESAIRANIAALLGPAGAAGGDRMPERLVRAALSGCRRDSS